MVVISVCQFLKEAKIGRKAKELTIKVDVSKEIFLKNIVFLYHHLLYPLVLRQVKVKVINNPFPYEAMEIAPLFLHTNREAITLHLYLEAWDRLLKIKEDKNIETKKYSLEELNEEQMRAVKIQKGPVLVLAGAGSGKTKTLINRIYYLLNRGVKENHILVLAYNKKAEEELTARLGNEIKVEIRTFHAFGNQLLKQYSDFSFYEEDPSELSRALLERILNKHHPLIYGKGKDPLKGYQEKISAIKNNLYTTQEMLFEMNHQTIDFYPIFKDYMKELEEEKIYDYDDMLYLAVGLLLKEGRLRKVIQEKYQYLLVDEFQDLNPLQIQLLEILALPENHLFVVGDDDQMIYGFRGASVLPILSFQKKYPMAKMIKLTTNYRSSKRIVYHAKQFIDHNLTRISKEIRANKKERGIIDVKIAPSLLEEANEVYTWVQQRKETEPITILYRYNEYGWFLKLFFALKGNKEEKVSTHFSKLFRFLSFFLDSFDLAKAQTVIKELELTWNPKITQWEELVQSYPTIFFAKIKEALTKKDLSFRHFCLLLHRKPSFFIVTEEVESTEASIFFERLIASFGGMKAFYYESKKEKTNQLSVQFATIHKTKGNEFAKVVYFHMVPPKDKALLEEERRISYVALTRAKEELLITTNSYAYQSYVKDYLNNDQLEDQKESSLRKRLSDLKEQIFITQTHRQLLYKDFTSIKKRIAYEVQEEVATYYSKEKERLNQLDKELSQKEQEQFVIEEEIWARSLSPSKKYAIISLEKGCEQSERK